MSAVRTTEGALVAQGPRGTEVRFTQEQAEADARERNGRAEELGIKTRYVVTDE